MNDELAVNLLDAVSELECHGLFAEAAAVKYAAAVLGGGGDAAQLLAYFTAAVEAERRPLRVVRHTS
jgi:hypothetical protein